MDDDDFETYGNEELPDYRLTTGLDLNKLRLGEGQEFEVEAGEAQQGKVRFASKCPCFMTVVQCLNNISSSVHG